MLCACVRVRACACVASAVSGGIVRVPAREHASNRWDENRLPTCSSNTNRLRVHRSLDLTPTGCPFSRRFGAAKSSSFGPRRKIVAVLPTYTRETSTVIGHHYYRLRYRRPGKFVFLSTLKNIKKKQNVFIYNGYSNFGPEQFSTVDHLRRARPPGIIIFFILFHVIFFFFSSKYRLSYYILFKTLASTDFDPLEIFRRVTIFYLSCLSIFYFFFPYI